MKLSQILTIAGAGAINSVVPGAGTLVAAAVNAFLPDDKKISPDATGDEVAAAVNSLPPAHRSALMEKELDVEIEEIKGFTARFAAAAEADKSGSSTRPAIALMMARSVCFVIVVYVAAVAVAIILDNSAMVEQISGTWAFIGVLLGVPSALLKAYFGMRTQEKTARYQLANEGQAVDPPGQILTALAGMIKGRK